MNLREIIKKIWPNFWTVKTKVHDVLGSEEIVVLDALKLFTERSFLIIIFIIPFYLIGTIAGNSGPEEYEATATILSEESGTGSTESSNALSGLAALAGINTESMAGGSTSNFGPSFYPTIIGNTQFLLELSVQKFYFENYGDSVRLYDYLIEFDDRNKIEKIVNSLSSPKQLIAELKGENIKDIDPSELNPRLLEFANLDKDSLINELKNPQEIPSEVITKQPLTIRRLTANDLKVIAKLKERIEILPSGNFISLTTKMPEALVSAQLNNFVFQKVISAAILYRTEKQRRDLKKLEVSNQEVKRNFEIANSKLANFVDSNKGIISEAAKTQEKLLQARMAIAQSLYTTNSMQLEQAKVDLMQVTPLYLEFEPVSIPLAPAKSEGRIIAIKYASVGAFLALVLMILWIMFDYYRPVLKPSNEY